MIYLLWGHPLVLQLYSALRSVVYIQFYDAHWNEHIVVCLGDEWTVFMIPLLVLTQVSRQTYIFTTCECVCWGRLSLLTLEPSTVLPPLHRSHHWHLTDPDYWSYSHVLVFAFQSAFNSLQVMGHTHTHTDTHTQTHTHTQDISQTAQYKQSGLVSLSPLCLVYVVVDNLVFRKMFSQKSNSVVMIVSEILTFLLLCLEKLVFTSGLFYRRGGGKKNNNPKTLCLQQREAAGREGHPTLKHSAWH